MGSVKSNALLVVSFAIIIQAYTVRLILIVESFRSTFTVNVDVMKRHIISRDTHYGQRSR